MRKKFYYFYLFVFFFNFDAGLFQNLSGILKFFIEKKAIEKPKNPFRKGSFEAKDEKEFLLKILGNFFWTEQEKNQKRTKLLKKVDQLSTETAIAILKTKLIINLYKQGGLDALIELKEIFFLLEKSNNPILFEVDENNSFFNGKFEKIKSLFLDPKNNFVMNFFDDFNEIKKNEDAFYELKFEKEWKNFLDIVTEKIELIEEFKIGENTNYKKQLKNIIRNYFE